jgi:DNA uptake protein ComE-like DNA-binding protein
LNAHSSRSHAILCVKLTQTTDTTVRISRASAIDLAGSEDNRRTDNNRERLVESASINKSLFVLAQCVEAISKKQTRIPYRESKMTRILSLGQNNGLTLMILNLAPVRSYHLDTLSSLNFANRTKKIEVAEIENEPVFKFSGKPTGSTMATSIGSEALQRQPLRPLTAAKNANLHEITQKSKPMKAFNVYSDSAKSVRPSNSNVTAQRTQSNTLKRGQDCTFRSAPPAKRLSPSKPSRITTDRYARTAQTSGLTANEIEALIDAKLAEKLADKSLSSSAAPTAALPVELQARLDRMEQRIEASEDKSREEGLHYLLMAKQHQARGEDNSALKMLKLAKPYFPDMEKLDKKIESLKEIIRLAKERREEEQSRAYEEEPFVAFSGQSAEGMESYSTTTVQQDSSFNSAADAVPIRQKISGDVIAGSLKSSKKPKDSTYDESFEAFDNDGSCYSSDDDFVRKKKPSKSVTSLSKTRLAVFRDLSSNSAATSTPVVSTTAATSSVSIPNVPPTPRTSHLLRIINTRDASQIRGLKGVGAKKAEAIVSAMSDMDRQALNEGWKVSDLETLAALRGVGVKGVENMRAGLGVVMEF